PKSPPTSKSPRLRRPSVALFANGPFVWSAAARRRLAFAGCPDKGSERRWRRVRFSLSFGLLLRRTRPFSFECPKPQVLSFRGATRRGICFSSVRRSINRPGSKSTVLRVPHPERGWRRVGFFSSVRRGYPCKGYLVGCKINFCTRQFSNSATYNSFSDGQAISCIHPNCFNCFPDSPSIPRTFPSRISL